MCTGTAVLKYCARPSAFGSAQVGHPVMGAVHQLHRSVIILYYDIVRVLHDCHIFIFTKACPEHYARAKDRIEPVA